MDKEIAPEIIRKNRFKKIVKGLFYFCIFVLVLATFSQIVKPRIRRSRIRTSTSRMGSITGSVTASGVVIPQFEQVITSPFESKIDSIYHKAGDNITLGEPILKLNNEFTLLRHEKILDEYELAENRKKQLQLSIQRNLIDLGTQLEIMNLQVESFQTKLAAQKLIYESGGGARAKYDQAKLDLDIAQLQKKQLEQNISNQTEALTADLVEIDLEIRIQRNRIRETEKQLELAEARSARDGVITWVNDEIGSTVRQGDIIARIADLNHYKVEARISDIHAASLINNGPVIVRVNDEDLIGTISNIKPMIENGVISFTIALEKNTHSTLRSNLRVDVFVITSSRDNVIIAENGPYINGAGRQNIYVIEGNKAVRKTVFIGETNFDFVEITSGIDPGEEIIITDMSDQRDRKSVKIINK
jgi:HlyD family secretion protein